MVLMVQHEVAEKICAKDGKMSLLAISVQFYSDPEYVKIVKADSFFPVPKVDSAIIKIKNIGQKLEGVKNIDLFFQIVKAGFSQKRKKLHNSIARNLRMDEKEVASILKSAGIDSNRRAETLSLKEWEKVYLKWK
jgi:16S rRNA (adenine1518-N6/adenine1519-N6)-dimethyltransferase